MKTKLLIALLSIIVFAYACKKEDEQIVAKITDITNLNWKLQSIIVNADTFYIPASNGDFQRPDAYVLNFGSDNHYIFPSNTNLMSGYYQILSSSEIKIIFGAMTNAGEGDNWIFNDTLRNNLNKLNSYTVSDSKLLLNGINVSMEFKLD